MFIEEKVDYCGMDEMNIDRMTDSQFWSVNRTGKEKTIWYVTRKDPMWNRVRNEGLIRYLDDEYVIYRYMEKHSSNKLLLPDFIIDVKNTDMLTSISSMNELIKYLDVGYDKNELINLLRLSISEIVRREIKKYDITDVYSKKILKEFATKVWEGYRRRVEILDKKLAKKKEILDEIENLEIQGLEKLDCGLNKNGNRQIGFTANWH